MADTPSATPTCAFCDWKGEHISQPSAPVVRQLEQEAVLAHHVSAHGFPTPPGTPRWEWLTYDPTEEAVVSVRRNFAGILLVDDGVVRQLEDDRPDTLDGLGPIVRQVLIARLRAWADQLGDAVEVRTLGGERAL